MFLLLTLKFILTLLLLSSISSCLCFPAFDRKTGENGSIRRCIFAELSFILYLQMTPPPQAAGNGTQEYSACRTDPEPGTGIWSCCHNRREDDQIYNHRGGNSHEFRKQLIQRPQEKRSIAGRGGRKARRQPADHLQMGA